MNTSLTDEKLTDFVIKQLNFFYPDEQIVSNVHLKDTVKTALDRIEFCFSKMGIKYYNDNGIPCFNHLNADHYAMFLYFLSNTAFKNKLRLSICSKIFLLNKALHGVDAFYEVELPGIFLFVHPIGTIIGRAKYADYFVIYQGCNIGSNRDIYPVFSEYVTMHPGAGVLGNCKIGKNCRIAARSLVLDRNIEPNTTYIGNPKNYITKENMERNSVWQG